jgi:hypothetical protein
MSDLTLSWSDLRERACNHNELSADQRRDAVLAFETLEDIFGTRFFNNKQHPLFFFFFDRSGWRCEWAIWFASFLTSIDQHPDFQRLIQELKTPSLCPRWLRRGE